jgi:hypothetical protein
MARTTMDMLKEFSGKRFILKELWPPKFPDLTYPDLYCGFFLKNVCIWKKSKKYIINASNDNVICSITRETLIHVSRNMVKGNDAHIQHNEGHFKQML